MLQHQPTATAKTRRAEPSYKPQRPQPQRHAKSRRSVEHVAVLGYN